MNVHCGSFKILGTKIDLDFDTALKPSYLWTSILPEHELRQFEYD